MASYKGSKRKSTKRNSGAPTQGQRKSARDVLLDKMRDSPQLDTTIVLDDHPDLQKMSEVLLEFAAPLLEPLPPNDHNAFCNALTVGVMCWNAALAGKNEREEVFRKFLS